MPSLFKATVCEFPAAIATTSLSPKGTLTWPPELPPHATTVPSLFKATVCEFPAAIATTLRKPTCSFVWPSEFLPHATTVPVTVGRLSGKSVCRVATGRGNVAA